MRVALLIAAKDLRQRLRDRSAIILAVVAPLAISAILSLALGGAEEFRPSYAVANLDDGDIGTAFAEQVLGSPGFTDFASVTEVASAEEAQQAVAQHTAAAAFIVAEDATEAVQSGALPELTVVTNPDAPIAGTIAIGLAESFLGQIDAARVATLTAVALGAPTDDIAAIAQRAAQAVRDVPVVVESASVTGVTGVGAASYFAPAMAIFFLFFTVGFGARSLLSERRDGTLARLLAAPSPRAAIVLGKALAAFTLGLVSVVVVIAASTFLLGAEFHSWLGVAMVIVAIVFTATAVTGLVTTLARTPEQADGYSSVIAMIFALLGGNFLPLSQAPESLQRLSVLTPNGWALRGFTELSIAGTTAADVVVEVGAVAAFGIVCAAITLLRARRLVAVAPT